MATRVSAGKPQALTDARGHCYVLRLGTAPCFWSSSWLPCRLCLPRRAREMRRALWPTGLEGRAELLQTDQSGPCPFHTGPRTGCWEVEIQEKAEELMEAGRQTHTDSESGSGVSSQLYHFLTVCHRTSYSTSVFSSGKWGQY